MVIVHADGSVEWEEGTNRELQVGLQAAVAQAFMFGEPYDALDLIPLPCSSSLPTAPPLARFHALGATPVILEAHQSSGTPSGLEVALPYTILLPSLACQSV